MGKITEELIKETYGLDSITINGCILIPFYQVIDKLNKLAKIEQICKESFSNSQDSILAIARIREVLVQE